MDDMITRHLERLLRESKNIFVPVDQLYEQLVAQGMGPWMDEDLLLQLLVEEGRFIVLDGLEEALFTEESLFSQRLRELGLLRGPWVVLGERILSPSVVMADLLHYLRELHTALEAAWQTMASEEPDVADDILSLLMMGDMLERQVEQALRDTVIEDLQALMEGHGLFDEEDKSRRSSSPSSAQHQR